MFKTPSTPANPEAAILGGLRRWASPPTGEIIHGSTVATNALLERKGARTALVTTAGFEDVLAIGRQTRPDLYDIFTTRPEPLVGRRWRIGVRQRTLADGTREISPSPGEIRALVPRLRRWGIESVAVCLLFSFDAPEDERAIRDLLAPLGIPISLSSEILPEYREYERTSTTVVNAYLRPVMERYLGRLDRKLAAGGRRKLRVMQSNGGAVQAEAAMAAPVRTILSGPAGGVVGAFFVAARSGYPRIITFDMGGTSTDVSLLDGDIPTTHESALDGMPIGVPMMDIHTVGAGGGSIASLDPGGALQVGPRSAGADPGPICYGRGAAFTVTDANVLLGRLLPRFFLGGEMTIDPRRIDDVLGRLRWARAWKTRRELASGVIAVVNNNMEHAIRLISVERGHDVRDFTLVCFGGAGGLHAATLARGLGIPRVLVPPHPGALSALGLLLADVRRDYARSLLGTFRPSAGAFRTVFAAMHRKGLDDLREEGFGRREIVIADALDVRYQGQSYELTVPYDPSPGAKSWEERFHAMHERRYGYANPRSPVEAVTARSALSGKTVKPDLPPAGRRRAPVAPSGTVRAWCDGKWGRSAVHDRSLLTYGTVIEGPAIIGEYSSTTWVPPDFRAGVDRFGNLILTRGQAAHERPA